MRTTLELDDDVLQATEVLAKQQGKTAGRVVSDLLRRVLMPSQPQMWRNGVPLLSSGPRAQRPSLDLVNRLREGE